jgi:hypothetical protein
MERMSASEFTHWLALYNIEYQEREKARRDAEDKSRAQRLSRTLR